MRKTPSIFISAALSWWVGAAASSDYAGTEACRKCHADEFSAQSKSAHARALARSQPPQPGDWAFGAGLQAVTFVTRVDTKSYREEGESWYRELGGYARTPGHTGPGGILDRIFDPSATILRCFMCHSTGPLRVDDDHGIVPFEPGIRCEVCHGPAARHAREPVRFHLQTPGRLSADELNAFCGQCHRMPAPATATPDLSNPWNARHQPPMLAASACFSKSGGRLSCLTCHSPHGSLERNAAAYDRVCDQCHAGLQHKADKKSQACVSCHMPQVEAQRYLRFANHRIGVYDPSDPMAPLSVRE